MNKKFFIINLNLKRVIKNEIFYRRNFRYVGSCFIFYSIKLSKKNGEFDKYILVSYIIIFKNSLIFFYLLIITPIIFLIYLIVKKDISNKGIKLILLVFYEVLLIYLSLEIIIAIGYQ